MRFTRPYKSEPGEPYPCTAPVAVVKPPNTVGVMVRLRIAFAHDDRSTVRADLDMTPDEARMLGESLLSISEAATIHFRPTPGQVRP